MKKKTSEIKDSTAAELHAKGRDLRQELFNLRLQQASSQLEKPSRRRTLRKDIARVESYHEGSVPLHTLRAEIDYGFAEAFTVYGKLGIKVWVCKGEKKPEKAKGPEARRAEAEAAAAGAPIGA